MSKMPNIYNNAHKFGWVSTAKEVISAIEVRSAR
jgi:hypothetical protein